MMDWFRMYKDMPSDPKVGTLTDAQFRTWVELLCVACKEEDHGNTKLTDADINWALRRNVSETLQELLHRKLIAKNTQGEYFIVKWDKCQYKSDSSTKRVQKFRNKNNNITKRNVSETLQERYCNGLEQNRTEQSNKKEIDKSISKKSYFEEFWEAYPNKTGKKPCLEKWKRRKLDDHADKIIADVKQKSAFDARWLDGFIPNPETYLNQERWNDPIKQQEPRARGSPFQNTQSKTANAISILESMKSANKTTTYSTVVPRLDSERIAETHLLETGETSS